MSRRNLIVDGNIILPFAKGAAKWIGTDGKTGQEQNTAAKIESAAPLLHDTGYRHSMCLCPAPLWSKITEKRSLLSCQPTCRDVPGIQQLTQWDTTARYRSVPLLWSGRANLSNGMKAQHGYTRQATCRNKSAKVNSKYSGVIMGGIHKYITLEFT